MSTKSVLVTKNREANELRSKADQLRADLADASKDFTAEEVENLPVCVNKAKSFWAREAGFAKAAGARLSLDAGVSPIMSSSPHDAHIDFDRNATTSREISHKRAVISEKVKTTKTDSALLLTGTDREVAMAQLSSSY